MPHTFHIPVMGLAFTIDSPIKIAKYGISSVISIVDDFLIERMNEYYSKKFDVPFEKISTKIEDYRAKRITSYLNTVDQIVKKSFDNLKSNLNDSTVELEKYLEMLPDISDIKKRFQQAFNGVPSKKDLEKWIDENLIPGAIDVNIMTKLDKVNYRKKEALPIEFNDAHAALRGFANSNLSSSVVLSAGMNPRLYSYFENFKDFYPDENHILKKKIILKVSDYRSALIQGKFLAKKGLWVSEFRIESGLNCGGHAFASDGYLMGPILEEFKRNKEQLINDVFTLYSKALIQKNIDVPKCPPVLKITAQGGVGTSEEHEFLLSNYKLDAVGWGSPFLLVPEATTVDPETIKQLETAEEKDLYLSNISPLGVPFNSLKGTSNELLKTDKILKGKAGSSCPKKFLVSNTEFSDKAVCTASRKYQSKKLESLGILQLNSSSNNSDTEKITDKACLCEGLANSAYISNDLEIKGENQGIAICPGPNMAYFSKSLSLKEMVAHIYGKTNVIHHERRPHMFLKELKMYIDHFKKKAHELSENMSQKHDTYLNTFKNNLFEGINYYYELFNEGKNTCLKNHQQFIQELKKLEKELFEVKHLRLAEIPIK